MRHIVESIEKIEILLNGVEFSVFEEKWQIHDAVIRNFEIIGEASKNVNQEIKNKYPDIDWKPAYSMRNFLIHEYYIVDLEAVYETAKTKLPLFKNGIQQILKNLNNL